MVLNRTTKSDTKRKVFSICSQQPLEYHSQKYHIDPSLITKGLCWCEGMEKEAKLQLNTRAYVRLRHKCFQDRITLYTERLGKIINTLKSETLTNLMQQNTQTTIHIDEYYNLTLINDLAVDVTPYSYYESPYVSVKTLFDEALSYRLTLCKDNSFGRPAQLQKCVTQYALKLLKRKDNKILEDVVHKTVLYNTRIDEIPCTCRGCEEPALRQILPIAANTKEVICYNSCLRTLFAAFKRQLQRVHLPDPIEVHKFQEYTKQYFNKYVLPVLRDFDYSYAQWYNHMPRHKQEAMDQAEQSIRNKPPTKVEYGLFCKREKQEAGGKNRAIANIDANIKYIMGPVCWSLEQYASRFFPGYCGGKNFNDLEDMFSSLYTQGYKFVLQGDGSAFDTCQHVETKLIDRLIYNALVDLNKIHHVDPKLFRFVATANERHLNAKYSEAKSMRNFAKASIYGTVFSGASDTTLMNTLRMAIYNMYTLERVGLKYGEDFHLIAKGDDFCIFSRHKEWQHRTFEEIYYDIWAPKPKSSLTTRYGLKGIGQILKFLIVGDYTTIDFCSTMCVQEGDKFKLFRKPDRMDPLGHYSRSALKMQPGQFKQYLLDLAFALEDSAGTAPLYSHYAKAYRIAASRINAKPTMLQTGRSRKFKPHDGHHTLTSRDHELEYYYRDYGHDYVHGLIFRHSTHTISDEAVLDHLMRYYRIGANDIEHHFAYISSSQYSRIYDSLADCMNH